MYSPGYPSGITISGPTLTSCRYRCIRSVAVTLSDLCCCLYNKTGRPAVPSSLTTLGSENLSRNSRRGTKPPPELEFPSAVASLELGSDFGKEGISPLDIVENSPFDDIFNYHQLEITWKHFGNPEMVTGVANWHFIPQ